MKKITLLLALFTCVLMSEKSFAQVSFKINIGTQPIWGPVGYDYVEYYYLPDIEVYYNVSSQRYVYMEGRQWVSRKYLPLRYRGYDLYNSRKVVINERKPYMRHHDNKMRYLNSQDGHNRQSIRDSHEPKYYQNKYHPQHSQYKEYKRNEGRNKKNDRNNNANKNNHNKGHNKH